MRAARLRIFAWSGCASSSLVMAGAYLAGWVSPATDVDTWPLLQRLRSQAGPMTVGALTVLLGVLLLLGTWLALGRHVRDSGFSAKQLTKLCWWWGTPLVLAPVLFSRDVFSYIAQSRLLGAGIDPYRYGPSVLPGYLGDGADHLWGTVPAPYGPAWMGLESSVYRVSGAQPVLALLGFRILAIAGVALVAVYVPRLARLCGTNPAAATWVAVLNPLLLMHLLAAAHNDALMLGLLLAGITWAMEGRFLPAVVVISLAGAIKAPALLGIPFAVVAVTTRPNARPSWPRLLAIGMLTPYAVFAAANLVAGVGWGWVANLNAAERVRIWLTPTTTIGRILAQPAMLLGMGDRSNVTIGAARVVAAVAMVLIVLWLLITARSRTSARGLGLALLTVALLAPVLQPWYLLWALVLLAGSGLRPVEARVAIAATAALVLYSVVNTNATAVTSVAIKEGPSAALALCAGIALFIALGRPRYQRLREPLYAP